MTAALSPERIFHAAVELADEVGLSAMSMRPLAEALGVSPMAFYNHVENREAVIDGMVDTIVGQIATPKQEPGKPDDWKPPVRAQMLAARQVLTQHPWAIEAIETRSSSSPTVLAYMDSLMGLMRAGGLSPDLVHHAMHALSVRMWGMTRDVFPTPALPEDPRARATALEEATNAYPHIAELAATVEASGVGCNADEEFAFAIDILLDGFDRLHRSAWEPPSAKPKKTKRQTKAGGTRSSGKKG